MTKKKAGFNFWERNRLSNGYLLRKKVTKVAVSIIRAILLFGLCFLILQPILNKISVSFMEEHDLYDPIVVSIPRHFTTENYKLAADPDVMDYGNSMRNSLLIAVSIAFIQIAMCTLVGYGFARFKFPFKKFWFAMVLMVIIIPPQVIATSMHLHIKYFDFLGIVSLFNDGKPINLVQSPIPYFVMSAGCMGLKNGLYIYMVRQYFRNIPVDLEEAAYIDGCGTLRTFIRIMLPQAKPIITSCFLFAFVWQWTDGFYSRLFFQGTKLVSTELSRIVSKLGVLIGRVMGLPTSARITTQRSNQILSTGTLMIVFPVIFLYLFAQRQFVESLSSTGIKM